MQMDSFWNSNLCMEKPRLNRLQILKKTIKSRNL